MQFGAIEFGGKLGGYKIANHSTNQLPQDLASAIDSLFNDEKILGAQYSPLWYIGSQIVNGTNHLILAKQTRLTKDFSTRIVAIVINISTSGQASIVEIIDDSDLIEGSLPDMNLKSYFLNAIQGLIGVSYTPILYIGSQIVKGVNFYIIAESKIVRNGSDPYPSIITINVFQNESTLIGIEPLI